jgi:hypothetical protein
LSFCSEPSHEQTRKVKEISCLSVFDTLAKSRSSTTRLCIQPHPLRAKCYRLSPLWKISTVRAVKRTSTSAIEFLAAVRKHVCVVTRLRLDANLFEFPRPKRKGRGPATASTRPIEALLAEELPVDPYIKRVTSTSIVRIEYWSVYSLREYTLELRSWPETRCIFYKSKLPRIYTIADIGLSTYRSRGRSWRYYAPC